MKHFLKNPKKQILTSLLLLPIVALTVFALLQPQRIQQFASETFDSPPLFGCLQVGEGKQETCGTKLGEQTGRDFSLHGRPLEDQQVYYGDRLFGGFEYKNIGDLPIEIQRLTLYAKSGKTEQKVTFLPGTTNLTLKPGESTKVTNASYRFTHDESRGAWSIGGLLTDKNNQSVEVDTKKDRILVNATCTALRVQELTAKDKSNLKALCGKNPKSKVCSSRQYCEIFKGKDCKEPNVSDETDRWQCDQYVYLPKPEQDMLEEFCKVYPDSDACTDFCARTVGSKLCPDKFLFIDTATGKPIKFKHPRVLYVRDPDGLTFKYAKDYPTDKARVHKNVATQSALPEDLKAAPEQGAQQDTGQSPVLGDEITFVPDGSPKGGTSVPPPQFGTSCGGPCPPPPAAAPAVKARADALRAAGKPVCNAKEVEQNGICVPKLPPYKPNCFPNMVEAGQCRREPCTDAACDARNNKLFTFECNQGNPGTSNVEGNKGGGVFDAHIPGAGCRKIPPPQAAEPGGAAPPQCGVPTADPANQLCKLEANKLAPDPTKGRIADPRTCDANGNPLPPATKCTSLTVPEKAQDGDIGFAKECRSGRRDINAKDDPSGVNQFACCANSLSLREGCCGQTCGVWSQKAAPDGRVIYRDGAGRVCTNNADAEKNNFCAGTDKDGTVRTRDNTIPGDLKGTGGNDQRTPVGFLPVAPGTENAPCDSKKGNSECKDGLQCIPQQANGSGGCFKPAPVAPDQSQPDQICYQKKEWFNPTTRACIPPQQDTPAKSIPDGADAKCGMCNNVALLNGCRQSAAVCCQNTCSSGACHIPTTFGGIVYCGKAKPVVGPIKTEVDILPDEPAPAPPAPPPPPAAPPVAQPPGSQVDPNFKEPVCDVGQLNKKEDFDCKAKLEGYKSTYGQCMVNVVLKSQSCYESCRTGPVDSHGFKKLDQQCQIDKGCQRDYNAGDLACR